LAVGGKRTRLGPQVDADMLPICSPAFDEAGEAIPLFLDDSHSQFAQGSAGCLPSVAEGRIEHATYFSFGIGITNGRPARSSGGNPQAASVCKRQRGQSQTQHLAIS